MQSYELGKPFPHKVTSPPGGEGARIMIVGQSFDVCFFSTQPKDDRDIFRKSPLRYGVFEQDSIPFFLVDFPKEFSFDAPINASGIPSEWFSGTGNLITLYLLDSRTHIIHAMRAIGIEMAVSEQIRQICQRQLEKYHDPILADVKMQQLMHYLPTEMMIKQTTMYSLSKP